MTTEPFTSRPIVSREPGVVIRRPVLDKRRFAQPRPAWEVPMELSSQVDREDSEDALRMRVATEGGIEARASPIA
jgi:hypothetical protein